MTRKEKDMVCLVMFLPITEKATAGVNEMLGLPLSVRRSDPILTHRVLKMWHLAQTEGPTLFPESCGYSETLP